MIICYPPVKGNKAYRKLKETVFDKLSANQEVIDFLDRTYTEPDGRVLEVEIFSIAEDPPYITERPLDSYTTRS